jgi:hypothetical protein
MYMQHFNIGVVLSKTSKLDPPFGGINFGDFLKIEKIFPK